MALPFRHQLTPTLYMIWCARVAFPLTRCACCWCFFVGFCWLVFVGWSAYSPVVLAASPSHSTGGPSGPDTYKTWIKSTPVRFSRPLHSMHTVAYIACTVYVSRACAHAPVLCVCLPVLPTPYHRPTHPQWAPLPSHAYTQSQAPQLRVARVAASW